VVSYVDLSGTNNAIIHWLMPHHMCLHMFIWLGNMFIFFLIGFASILLIDCSCNFLLV
jgi:hypothetical protein